MSDPDFARPGILLIHGVGLIGGSIGLAAKRAGLVGKVVGCGRSLAKLQTALSLGAVDEICLDDEFDSACSTADLIVLCTPVSQIIADLPRVLSLAKPTAAVTDVGSVKGAIVDAAKGDPRFVGSHPMAGSEIAGVEAARADLFQEATWALTPTESTSCIALETVRFLANGVGATTRILAPGSHDEAVAVTSHLPHVIASGLVSLAADRAYDNNDLPYLSAGSFSDATRVAASLPKLWRDICVHNRSAISSALEQYIRELSVFQQALDEHDDDEIEAHFARGARAKRDWPVH